MVDTVETANAAHDDCINPANGLKYCGKCCTPKEAFYPADRQAQGFTKHPVMCKCAAERRGMTVLDTYVEEGKSGKRIEGRTAFQRMLDDI